MSDPYNLHLAGAVDFTQNENNLDFDTMSQPCPCLESRTGLEAYFLEQETTSGLQRGRNCMGENRVMIKFHLLSVTLHSELGKFGSGPVWS